MNMLESKVIQTRYEKEIFIEKKNQTLKLASFVLLIRALLFMNL